MAEPCPSWSVGIEDDHALPDGSVHRSIDRMVDERFEGTESELVAQNACRTQDRDDRFGELGQPAAQDDAQFHRDPHRGVLWRKFVDEQPAQLTHVERVATALAVDPLGCSGAEWCACGEVLGNLATAQWGQPQDGHGGAADYLPERRFQRAAGLGVAGGRQEQHGEAGDFGREQAEEVERGIVRPLKASIAMTTGFVEAGDARVATASSAICRSCPARSSGLRAAETSASGKVRLSRLNAWRHGR